MAEKTIKTKILLRYDVLSAWTSANPNLKTGEVAIVAIPTDSKELNINGTTPPQILFKVGPGYFRDLPYASGKAADVYSWAKEASLSIVKEGDGNVVSGIAWDAAANGGKGGIKFTTASVATSEELKGVQDRLTVIEGTGEKSRITLLEEGLAETNKVIEDNSAAWAKDDNTTYSFVQNGKSFTVTPSEGSATTITFDYLTADEVASAIAAYGYQDEDDVKAIVESYKYATAESLNNYYTKTEIDNKGFKDEAGVKSIVEGYGYQTSTQVENAITSKGYQTEANVNSLIANSDLAETVADNADDIAELDRELGELSGTVTGHINNKENPHGVTAAQVGAYTKAETDALFEPYRTAEAQDVIDKAITDDIAGLKLSVGNLSGAFQFKGTKDSIESLPTASTDNAGHVYVVGNKEYASDGSSWILLGDEGSYVLKTTYEAHLTAQAAVDQGQSDKIAAIEQDIADNRAAWASKTSVTDPTSGDGKITVDGTEITVYDDSALAGKVTTVEGKVKTLEETTVPALDNRIKEVEKIKVTSTSVTDGTNTFNKYDDTALAGRVTTVEGKVKTLEETTIPGINETISTLATKAEVETAIANSHTHSNKHILDATTASFTTDLQTKYDGYEGSISGVADRVTAVENEFKTVNDTKGKVVELADAVDVLEGKIDTLSVTETSVSYNGVTFNKYDDKALSDRVKVVEDNFADWAIIWDCGGASNN